MNLALIISFEISRGEATSTLLLFVSYNSSLDHWLSLLDRNHCFLWDIWKLTCCSCLRRKSKELKEQDAVVNEFELHAAQQQQQQLQDDDRQAREPEHQPMISNNP